MLLRILAINICNQLIELTLISIIELNISTEIYENYNKNRK